MNLLIEVSGLNYRYEDGTEALRGVDFQLEEGESVALLGPNGSGKTTFILHLNGLLRGQGHVRVGGLEVNSANLSAIRRKVGVVFQDAETQLFMPTVLEDVAFGPLNLGMEPQEAMARAREALAITGMEAALHRAPYHLSAGEKRRVALAGVLAMQPDILILDEPTTFLDPPGQRSLTQLLGGLPQARILVTHDVAFARTACTRAVFFQHGRITASGTVEEIVRRFDWLPAAPPR
jgi:cobalt/nickel transport system ATP-binding protein